MRSIFVTLSILAIAFCSDAQHGGRSSFNKGWTFHLGDVPAAMQSNFVDHSWRKLDLPHDWSIELPFDSTSPTGTGGGALRGGIGWYRKTFLLPATDRNRKVYIEFDGVYRNSKVWINGIFIGARPNGYISFRYDLTPHLEFGDTKNVIVVKVDNSKQPNSRWYSGSGIYRNVWLVKTGNVSVDYSGTDITTPSVSGSAASVLVKTKIISDRKVSAVDVLTSIYDPSGKLVATASRKSVPIDSSAEVSQLFSLKSVSRWSLESPKLYKAVTRVSAGGRLQDAYTTRFGIRTFRFDVDKGFFLNDKWVKIRGVCNHHDLGCLGTAINRSALKRQLQLLKDMGCNGIRTSHNPPAPELLDLCDEMGFIVMDESFDMWKRAKSTFDYSLDWDQWHARDLQDFIKRDRHHPSIFMWSIGNEIYEQWSEKGDTSGRPLIRHLHSLVRALDTTRPTVTANNETNPWNNLLQTNTTELIGYNYHHQKWDSVHEHWYRKPFIVTESVSALQTRAVYDMPSDSIRRWPLRWDLPFTTGNADLTCSAYDNCSTPWGSTHEETLRELEKYPHISGMYIWTGFDYLGEPTPYGWPARSSYFGIIDLAGFPKDVYYLYQSIWTNRPVLHLFPHWNWEPGQEIDLWAYYNNADEVELFINGISQGKRTKSGDQMHVMWRVKFEAGTIKAVSRKNGKTVLTKQIRTAGPAARIILEPSANAIGKEDLSFVTVKIVDDAGNLVPDADHQVSFEVVGGTIAGVDNGLQTSLESFQSSSRKAFNGLALAVLRPQQGKGAISITATSPGLKEARKTIIVK